MLTLDAGNFGKTRLGFLHITPNWWRFLNFSWRGRDKHFHESQFNALMTDLIYESPCIWPSPHTPIMFTFYKLKYEWFFLIFWSVVSSQRTKDILHVTLLFCSLIRLLCYTLILKIWNMYDLRIHWHIFFCNVTIEFSRNTMLAFLYNFWWK